MRLLLLSFAVIAIDAVADATAAAAAAAAIGTCNESETLQQQERG